MIWDLGQGGAQTYLLNLVREQKKDPELDPCLLVLSGPGALSDQFETLLKPEYLGMRGGLSVLPWLNLGRLIRQANPDLIHSHSNNLLFNFALHFISCPAVYTEHGGGLLGGRKQDYALYRYLYRPIDRWIAISGMMAELMQSANSDASLEIDLVYNGVNVEKIASTESHKGDDLDPRILNATHRIGIIGRLENQKGIDLFLRTAAAVSDTMTDAVFVIVGDGELRTELEQLAKKLGIDQQTCFLGYRPDAITLLKLFDVFLFTSKFEPFGLVITEAMAAEVPVVAVHTAGAVPEILSDKEDGIIVDVRNPDRAAEAVVALLHDQAARERIAQRALAKVESAFSIKANAGGVMQVYRRATTAAKPK